jgi:hypothetical protein
MNFLAQLLKGIAFVPAVVHGIEALFGSKTGTDKKAAAMSFIGAALSVTQAITNKDIVDAPKFQDGLSKVIDDVVACLNASAWAQKQ